MDPRYCGVWGVKTKFIYVSRPEPSSRVGSAISNREVDILKWQVFSLNINLTLLFHGYE